MAHISTALTNAMFWSGGNCSPLLLRGGTSPFHSAMVPRRERTGSEREELEGVEEWLLAYHVDVEGREVFGVWDGERRLN